MRLETQSDPLSLKKIINKHNKNKQTNKLELLKVLAN